MANNKEDKFKIIKTNPTKVMRSEYYEKMKWMITDKANFTLDKMINVAGMDPDLALYVLEEKWNEEEIYDRNRIK